MVVVCLRKTVLRTTDTVTASCFELFLENVTWMEHVGYYKWVH
jgi:hypothetical protein